jgi:hypothetical protein
MKKVENEKKAQALRAKLLAQRQATPLKQQSRANTPMKQQSRVATPSNASSVAPMPQLQLQTQSQTEPQAKTQKHESKESQQATDHDDYDITSLLEEGKAAAGAKAKQQMAPPQAPPQKSKVEEPVKSVEQTQTQRPLARSSLQELNDALNRSSDDDERIAVLKEIHGISSGPSQSNKVPSSQDAPPAASTIAVREKVQGGPQNGTQPAPAHPAARDVQPVTRAAKVHTPLTPLTPQQKPPNSLTDPYYADLSIWLDITGFHDVEYRTSKLRTFKERQALEAEAARINERLEKLRELEQAAIDYMRTAGVHRATTVQPPALPDLLSAAPTKKPTHSTVNGHKRPHSPDPVQSAKARREGSPNGFRIRGANASPDDRAPPTRGRLRSRSSLTAEPLDRRVSYPDARRQFDRNGRTGASALDTRDPSLERRQSYYKNESVAGTYDSYQPRLAPRGPGRVRPEYEGIDQRDRLQGPRRSEAPPYYGNQSLDLRRGGKHPIHYPY